jgi:Ion channel
MRAGFLRELIHLRRTYSDWLLTLLTILLLAIMFVILPLQAAGVKFFQGFGLLVFLAIIAGAMVISINPMALAVMLLAFITNLFAIGFRPFSYDVQIVAACWLIITLTLGGVVGRAVFGRGRVTYHRIVGAVLLYLLIALVFMMLFSFIGASFDDAFRGLTFEYDSALANRLMYFSFVTLTSIGYGDIVPVHPLAQSLCSLEAIIGQLYPAILLARLVTLETVANNAQNQ